MISPSSTATSLMKYFIREYFSTVKYFIMHASMLCPRAFAPPSPRLCLRACEKKGGGELRCLLLLRKKIFFCMKSYLEKNLLTTASPSLPPTSFLLLSLSLSHSLSLSK